MKLWIWIGVMVMILVTGVQVQADEILSFKAGYLMLNPEGEVAAEVSGIGTRVDVDDDLNLDDSEGLFAEAGLNFGPLHLSAAYIPLSFEGSGALTRDIDFNGTTFTATTDIDSEVEINLYDVGLTWYLINIDDLPVRFQFGPEIAVKLADAEVSISDGTTTETESVFAPIPTVGARLGVGLADYVRLIGRVGYMAYEDNQIIDADVQVEFSPLPFVGIFAGYRLIDLEVDESDVFIDTRFSGPYAGLMARF